VISHLPPPRLHKLEGERSGEYAVDLVHPLRLIFKINQTPIPLLSDGGVDRSKVTKIMILEVEDYHGK
jgi:putative killer suppression protein higA